MCKHSLVDDRDWMAIALAEARRAAAEDEVPIGAVVVLDGREVARAHNQPILRRDPSAHAEILALREAASREAVRINDCLVELEAIGCVFKGFEAGLVDFYALREDRLVFLCWHHGEDHIGHWHEVDGGFDGRQPLDELMLMETVAG